MKRLFASLLSLFLIAALLASCSVARSGGERTTATGSAVTTGTGGETARPAETTATTTTATETTAVETTAPETTSEQTDAPEDPTPGTEDDEYSKNY